MDNKAELFSLRVCRLRIAGMSELWQKLNYV